MESIFKQSIVAYKLIAKYRNETGACCGSLQRAYYQTNNNIKVTKLTFVTDCYFENYEELNSTSPSYYTVISIQYY